MTDPVSAAKRRRWRWLAAGVLVAAACFWLAGAPKRHPDGMVGLWRHSKNPGFQKQPLPDLRLRGDGTGEFVTSKGGSPMTWSAEGPLIIMQHDPRSVAESLQFLLSEAYSRILGNGWRRPQLRLYVTSLQPQRMVCSKIEPSETIRDSSHPEELFVRVEK